MTDPIGYTPVPDGKYLAGFPVGTTEINITDPNCIGYYLVGENQQVTVVPTDDPALPAVTITPTDDITPDDTNVTDSEEDLH